mmetsp:Transcript_17002/g.23896  ORF Transcript_17002/g.23896 Transcript_17002/m.23896 type:complete len:208 (+) Transcript_17002:116-739(+)
MSSTLSPIRSFRLELPRSTASGCFKLSQRAWTCSLTSSASRCQGASWWSCFSPGVPERPKTMTRGTRRPLRPRRCRSAERGAVPAHTSGGPQALPKSLRCRMLHRQAEVAQTSASPGKRTRRKIPTGKRDTGSRRRKRGEQKPKKRLSKTAKRRGRPNLVRPFSWRTRMMQRTRELSLQASSANARTSFPHWLWPEPPRVAMLIPGS